MPSAAYRSTLRSSIDQFQLELTEGGNTVGEIRYLPNRGLLKDESIQRIVAAANANAGLWLMVKERAVESEPSKPNSNA